MLHERFKKADIKEQIDEAKYIIIPGIQFLEKDFLNGWLTQRLDDTALSINPSLLLNKYPWWFQESNGRIKLDRDFSKYKPKGGTKKVSKHYNKEMLHTIAKFSAKPPEEYTDIRNRHYQAPDKTVVQHTILTTKTRLIVGLSDSASIFETGITLHPYYGFPVIPGSAIKGVVRHYCEEYKDGEIDNATIVKIFGGDSSKVAEGDVVFYDAWPEEWTASDRNKQPLLEIDIINPHYKDYYKENSDKLPTDNQDPNPIKFLVVKKGVQFRFAVRPSAKCKDMIVTSLAISFLKEAITTVGIGAKTGSSYGYFK